MQLPCAFVHPLIELHFKAHIISVNFNLSYISYERKERNKNTREPSGSTHMENDQRSSSSTQTQQFRYYGHVN